MQDSPGPALLESTKVGGLEKVIAGVLRAALLIPQNKNRALEIPETQLLESCLQASCLECVFLINCVGLFRAPRL